MKKLKEDRFKELIDCLYTGDYSVDITLDGRFRKFDFYDLKGEWLMYYNQKHNNYIVIRWLHIWSIFEDEYSMNYIEIRQFIKDMLLINFRIKNMKPICYK